MQGNLHTGDQVLLESKLFTKEAVDHVFEMLRPNLRAILQAHEACAHQIVLRIRIGVIQAEKGLLADIVNRSKIRTAESSVRARITEAPGELPAEYFDRLRSAGAAVNCTARPGPRSHKQKTKEQ